MRTDIQEDAIRSQMAHLPVTGDYLKDSRRNEPSIAKNQLRSALLIIEEVKLNQPINHSRLRNLNAFHVEAERSFFDAKLLGAMEVRSHFGTMNNVLARHTSNVRTGTANPFPLDNYGSFASFRKIPCNVFASLSTPQDRFL